MPDNVDDPSDLEEAQCCYRLKREWEVKSLSSAATSRGQRAGSKNLHRLGTGQGAEPRYYRKSENKGAIRLRVRENPRWPFVLHIRCVGHGAASR